MLKAVDDEEKVKVNNVHFENRTGGNGTWFLTEDGLYEVLMQSRKPKAKEFKKEVKKILKSIRKTGGYVVGSSRGYFQPHRMTALYRKKLDSKNEQKNFESAAAFSDL